MANEQRVARPVLLDASHDLSSFDCGVESLNEFLKKHALANQSNRSARTYVAARGVQAVGYYTLAAGSVRREDVSPRVAKGLARHPMPVVLFARLAVDKREQGRGLGRALLKDAVLRAAQASDIIGSRALLVHAKDASTAAFFGRFGFAPSPTNESHLFLLMKDIAAILNTEAGGDR